MKLDYQVQREVPAKRRRSRAGRFLGLLTTAAAFVLAACSGVTSDDAAQGAGVCRFNSDCALDSICIAGECIASDTCREDRDCVPGAECSGGVCTPIPTTGDDVGVDAGNDAGNGNDASSDVVSPPEEFGTGAIPMPTNEYQSLPTASPPSAGPGGLPSRVDLTPFFPPPGNQGAQGSCVGWAVGYALKTYHENVERGWSAVPEHWMSPSFVFNQIRLGDCRYGGAYISDALELIREQGIVSVSDFPYTAQACSDQPTLALIESAYDYRVDEFMRVQDIHDTAGLRGFIAAGVPIVVGIRVGDPEFRDLRRHDVFDVPGVTEMDGAHAVVLVGYDEALGTFMLYNSWGTGWGNDGVANIGYEELDDRIFEAWVTTDHLGGSTGDCDGGPCCVDGRYRDSNYVCSYAVESETGCPWGSGCGSAIGVRYRDRYCSGESSLCVGELSSWGDWEQADVCDGSEICGGGGCESAGICTEDCSSRADCPADTVDGWGACGSFSTTCDTTGLESRNVTTWQCLAGNCVSNGDQETRSCTRSTDGVTCSGGTCSGGSCVQANRAPSRPTIESISTVEVNSSESVSITVGTDPDGDDVKVQCTSAGSNYTDAAPYVSGWGSGGRTVTASFRWSVVGSATIYCTTFDRDGLASSTDSELLTVATGNRAPSRPTIESISTVEVNSSESVSITVGTDPDGDDVKVQCTSPGSNYTDASPYVSSWGSGGRSVTATFRWDSAGSATIYCTTFDRGGLASSTDTELLTVTAQSYHIDVDPLVGSWTATGPCNTSTSRALYRGSVVSVDAESNQATMSFAKCDGSNPSQNVNVWVVVGDHYPQEGSLCTASSCTRTSGIWQSSWSGVQISNVPIWPTLQDLEDAPCGSSKYLYIITDGAGQTGQRVWYQYEAIRFTKVCD